jgi:hypothetical protein
MSLPTYRSSQVYRYTLRSARTNELTEHSTSVLVCKLMEKLTK